MGCAELEHPLDSAVDRVDACCISLGQFEILRAFDVLALGLPENRAVQNGQEIANFDFGAHACRHIEGDPGHPGRDARYARRVEFNLSRNGDRRGHRTSPYALHLDARLLDDAWIDEPYAQILDLTQRVVRSCEQAGGSFDAHVA